MYPNEEDMPPPRNMGHGVYRVGDTSKLSPTPTEALPGTPEKVVVLEQRARMGVSLWHPLDATRT